MELAILDMGKTDLKLGITSLQPQNSNKLKAIWESLFDPDAFSEQYEDKDLQSVALLTGTIFSIFRDLRGKYEDAQKECKKLQNNLRATLANLDATKEELKIAKETQCQQCMQLQNELYTHQKKLEQLKSIVPILNCNNSLQLTKEALTPQKRVAFICDVVRSILLGDEFLDQNEIEIIEKNCKGIKRNVMGEKLSRRNLFPVTDSKNNDDKVWGVTLAAESYPNDENIPPDFPQNNSVLSAVDTLQGSPDHKNVRNETDTISNATPKKSIDFDVTLQNSPVLCSSNKKHKSSHFDLSQKSTPNQFNYNRVSDIVKNCSQENTQISPSLLNLDVLSSENNIARLNKNSDKNPVTEKAMMDGKTQDTHNMRMSHEKKQQQLNDTKKKEPKSEVWELKPQVSLTKLKQTTLNVSKATKTVDLSKIPTFFGGARVSYESNSLMNDTNGNYDEETALAAALQKSLKEIKTENNLETEAEEQEDIVNPSPTAESSKMFLRSSSAIRNRSQTLITSKSNAMTMHYSQLDETLFVPAHTSTQNHEMTSGVQKEKVKEEPARNMLQQTKEKFETSFDRIPQKPSTSPNFKYRRQAVRKRALREKLEGWDCAQCKEYYDALNKSRNNNYLKDRMNRCSRHRDKYQFQFNTPPGYWDVNFLSTQETVLESPEKKLQR